MQAWSAVVIAVMTAALVGITIVYVALTAKLAGYAKESAQSAERLLLLESMPLIIPQSGSGSRIGGTAIIHMTLTNRGRHAAVNGEVRVKGQGDLELGPRPFQDISPDEALEVTFDDREERLPLWKEGELSEFTIYVEYKDAIGNRYRVARTFRNRIWELDVTRYRDGEWENLTSPRT